MSNTTYRMSPHQTLTVRRSSADTGGELLEVEATWSGDGALPPAHFHPDQDEHDGARAVWQTRPAQGPLFAVLGLIAKLP